MTPKAEPMSELEMLFTLAHCPDETLLFFRYEQRVNKKRFMTERAPVCLRHFVTELAPPGFGIQSRAKEGKVPLGELAVKLMKLRAMLDHARLDLLRTADMRDGRYADQCSVCAKQKRMRRKQKVKDGAV